MPTSVRRDKRLGFSMTDIDGRNPVPGNYTLSRRVCGGHTSHAHRMQHIACGLSCLERCDRIIPAWRVPYGQGLSQYRPGTAV